MNKERNVQNREKYFVKWLAFTHKRRNNDFCDMK